MRPEALMRVGITRPRKAVHFQEIRHTAIQPPRQSHFKGRCRSYVVLQYRRGRGLVRRLVWEHVTYFFTPKTQVVYHDSHSSLRQYIHSLLK